MTVLLQDQLFEPRQRAKDRSPSDFSRRSVFMLKADGTVKHLLVSAVTIGSG